MQQNDEEFRMNDLKSSYFFTLKIFCVSDIWCKSDSDIYFQLSIRSNSFFSLFFYTVKGSSAWKYWDIYDGY